MIKVEYLRYFIDPQKVEAMCNWPLPQTFKQLRSFLGLVGYYRRFIKDYVIIAKPLTDMLKKEGFKWSEKAKLAFKNLTELLSSTTILALLNFSKEFMVEAGKE